MSAPRIAHQHEDKSFPSPDLSEIENHCLFIHQTLEWARRYTECLALPVYLKGWQHCQGEQLDTIPGSIGRSEVVAMASSAWGHLGSEAGLVTTDLF